MTYSKFLRSFIKFNQAANIYISNLKVNDYYFPSGFISNYFLKGKWGVICMEDYSKILGKPR